MILVGCRDQCRAGDTRQRRMRRAHRRGCAGSTSLDDDPDRHGSGSEFWGTGREQGGKFVHNVNAREPAPEFVVVAIVLSIGRFFARSVRAQHREGIDAAATSCSGVDMLPVDGGLMAIRRWLR